ncbi:response regulator transcription factor [Novosphingobium sp. BL-8A]|uniref:response regulator n=1 Tax=Novosphingobium sp. BL-8A TaxID=3127639 RepID=UPI0037565AD0
MRVLLAEDDHVLSGKLADVLRSEKFAVDLAVNGEDAAHLGDTESYDAAVLDLGLPGIDGLRVLEEWRAAGRGFPVLILTARDTWTDKVAGFKAGADDYLTKPFIAHEVVLRLRALIRRSAGHATTVVRCGPLTHDTQSGSFALDNEPLKLTAFEWRILSALILRKGVVVPRASLFEHVYEYHNDVESNSVEVIIGRLRRKIGASMIETVRGHGYRLVATTQ